MDDVMEIARERQEELAKAIAGFEAEIVKLREEVETVARFIKFGEKLKTGGTLNDAAMIRHDDKPDASGNTDGDNIEPLQMPTRQAHPA